MIEGLKVRIPGTTLIALACERVKEHDRKAAGYEDANASLRAADEDHERGTSMDPAGQVKAKIKEHTSAAAYWQMIADYAVVGEDYQLGSGEVRQLLGQERVY